jgi:hypothetical protein
MNQHRFTVKFCSACGALEHWDPKHGCPEGIWIPYAMADRKDLRKIFKKIRDRNAELPRRLPSEIKYIAAYTNNSADLIPITEQEYWSLRGSYTEQEPVGFRGRTGTVTALTQRLDGRAETLLVYFEMEITTKKNQQQ